MATRGSLPPTDLRWCQSEISSTAEASRIRQNPNSSRRITAHILIVSNRKSKFHWLLHFRRLTEFKLFGNNPVARHAERPELPGEVRNERDLATQHHSIIFQRRNLGCDLGRGDPPTGRCCPQDIVNVRLSIQVTLTNFGVINRVLFVAGDVIEPNPPEIVAAELKSKHAEKRRDTNAGTDKNKPAERSESVGGEPTERAVHVHVRTGL